MNADLDAKTDPEATSESNDSPSVATSVWAWRLALVTCLIAVAARLPVLRAYADSMLARSPDIAASVDGSGFRDLALNIGVVLAVLLSGLLFWLYQSLGRALEKHVFTRSLRIGGVSVGLFFMISTCVVIPVHVFCAVTGTVSLRTSALYYPIVAAVTIACTVVFHLAVKRLTLVRVSLLYIIAVMYGMMSALI